MDFVPLLAALALVVKIIDFVKAAKNGDANGIVTQLTTWVAGVAVVFLLAASDFGTGIDVAGYTLDGLNNFSLVLLGLSISSSGSLAFDFKKSFDNTDSAAVTPLISTPLTK